MSFSWKAEAAPTNLRSGIDDPTEIPDCEKEPCFTLTAVAISGASVYAPAQLAPYYEPSLGRLANIETLSRIAHRITDRYRSDGYFLSRAVVPAQGLRDSGVGQILVIEGWIAEIVIEGDGAPLAAPFLDGFDTSKPVILKDLDRRLALAREVPGLVVQSRLEPDPRDPGRHRLIVAANLKRVDSYASLDNRGTNEIGPWHAFAQVNVNSALTRRDQLGLSVFTNPGDFQEFSLIETSYAYVMRTGARASLSLSAWRRHDGHDPISSSLGGDGRSLSLRFDQPLYSRRAGGLWLSTTFDARYAANDWAGGGGYVDETRVLRLGLRGTRNGTGSSSSISVFGSLGLDVLGASGRSIFERSRYDATGRFAKVNLRLAHYQELGRYFGVFASADAQWSADPLLVSEEFSVGGQPYGRGYDYGELTGDHGVAGMIELRAGFAPNLSPITFVQGYGFVDSGQVWNYNSFPGTSGHSLASAGVGTRVTLDEHVTLNLEAARPLTRTPFEARDKDWRHYIGVSIYY